MNTLFTRFSFILTMTFSGVCLSGEQINQSLSVDSKGIVFVDIPRGVVSVEGWDKPQVMVQGELDDTIKQLIFQTKQGKTLIKVDTQGKQHWGDVSSLKVFMPQKSQLRFKGVDTSFTITKLNNHIEGKSISGNLVVANSSGKIKLSVVSGDINVFESSGLAKVESVSGTVNFSGGFEQAFLKSMSGDITADISGINKLMLKNVSGNTQISGQVKDQAQLKFTSVNGDINYRSTSVLNAECDLMSQFGGEIDNQFTDDLPIESSLHKKTLNFVSGDGSGKLIMNTVTGSITIKKDNK